MNTTTMEKKWSGENQTNRTGGDGPAQYDTGISTVSGLRWS